ncbi:hypothetical protein [Yinghuangia seranimata]|nr:hypothetical protein [Yinghuangia seranimata]MDI2124940.1 hypothetical protein [Yinghuangia seranimata]
MPSADTQAIADFTGPSIFVYNDMTHLPTDLRWTGFPAQLRTP